MSEIYFNQQAAPSSPPASGSNLFYFGVDGAPKYMNSAGVETTFAAATTNLTYLGSTVLTVAAPQTNIVTLTSAMNRLWIQMNITGYSGADIASFQFGTTAGVVDTGNNYWSRHLTSVAGGIIWVNTQVISTNMIRIGGIAVTTGRTVICDVMNRLEVSKTINIRNSTNTNAAATAGTIDVGSGEWINTTGQIISVRMIDQNGTNLTAGSGFVVWGANI